MSVCLSFVGPQPLSSLAILRTPNFKSNVGPTLVVLGWPFVCSLSVVSWSFDERLSGLQPPLRDRLRDLVREI